MDSKAECVQLNLAHVARKNIKKETKNKQTPVPPHKSPQNEQEAADHEMCSLYTESSFHSYAISF